MRGRVQGVGFRPNVYRLARELGLAGEVMNDAEGVLIRASGSRAKMASFLERIALESPPLAHVEIVETRVLKQLLEGEFRIAPSATNGASRAEVTPDAAICGPCAREILSPSERRFRYPFTTCTHCGPRLSIVQAVPYDRVTTTMRAFPLCELCNAEYTDPTNRRFHAEATACPACGPKVDGDIDAVLGLLQKGEIVAIKGVGGFQLACDATRADIVERLRERKKRDAKPFALMARDLDVIRRFCAISAEEAALLESPEAPIVLLDANGPETLPEAIAPGHRTLGFMLPTTPLHVLILRDMDRPVVMTSGNISDAPAVIRNEDARGRLANIADTFLIHDREIANRVDDSVTRVMNGKARIFRRARGYAPAPIRLPPGFDSAPPLLAYGAELKSTFCLMANGEAILSQHQGDLDDANTFDDYQKNLALYADLFEHRPEVLISDRHPSYVSSKLARDRATAEALPLIEVQHHHAHAAACLAENHWAIDGAPVLAIVLDGLGLGDDGEIWGGEFLLADYQSATRLGTFKPVAMIGGDRASREPWRNLYAHLMAEMGWSAFDSDFRELAILRQLDQKPRDLLDRMLTARINAPLASSCGRLFDAVAAAVGISFERQAYEGQAGALLEAIIDEHAMDESDELAYPFSISRRSASSDPNEISFLEPLTMWRALLRDLRAGTPVGLISARFHRGLARAITTMALALRGAEDAPRFSSVALSGGCFQNRVLFEETSRRLRAAHFDVLLHSRVPPNDGGIALGQAAVAAARLIKATQKKRSS